MNLSHCGDYPPSSELSQQTTARRENTHIETLHLQTLRDSQQLGAKNGFNCSVMKTGISNSCEKSV